MVKGLVLFAVCMMGTNMQAQSFTDLLKVATDKLGNGNSAVASLIGTTKVSESTLAGSWKYAEPAIAFESSDLLKSTGAKLVSGKLGEQIEGVLTKYNISPDDLTFTFNKDKSYTCVAKGRTTKGYYELKDATITLYSNLKVKRLSANVKVSGETLQVTFKADKLLSFISTIGSSVKSSPAISTLSKLAGSYDGMQIGISLKKIK